MCDGDQEDRDQRLSSAVFENMQEGAVITDARNRIVQVNAACTRITGFTADEVQGLDPGVFKSGHHDAAFYRAMWERLREDGRWSGEIWDRRKDGTLYAKWLTISAVKGRDGAVTHYIGVFSDATEWVRFRRQLEHRAYHDPLTDLPNKLLFLDRVAHAVERSRGSSRMLALLMLDLDHFKEINEVFGYPAGDRLLQQAAERLRDGAGDEDTVARLGGNLFGVCLEAMETTREAFALAEWLNELMSKPFDLDGRTVRCACSIGISVYPRDGECVEELIGRSESALHKAKRDGRNAVRAWSEEITRSARRRSGLAQQLRSALQNDEFVLHYQPQVEIATGRVAGIEALVRWRHPEEGLLHPGQFIYLAEERGLLPALGDWVIEAACRQGRWWLDEGHRFGRLAVNVSAQQIQTPGLLDTVSRVLRESGLPAEQLELEITESALVATDRFTVEVLQALRQNGIRLAIDDFGTGYSSLLYLKRLPIHRIKIDMGFVRDMTTSPESRGIVQTIITLARTLGLEVVAEGVEMDEQRRLLLVDGAGIGQGFFWAQPAPGPDFPVIAAAPWSGGVADEGRSAEPLHDDELHLRIGRVAGDLNSVADRLEGMAGRYRLQRDEDRH